MAVLRLLLLLATATLTACGFVQPGRPGHEPDGAGRYNTRSGEVNGV